MKVVRLCKEQGKVGEQSPLLPNHLVGKSCIEESP